jgi:hypothetical protein
MINFIWKATFFYSLASNTKGWFEEQCGKSATKNAVSSGVNIGGGLAISAAIAFAPVTGGLSIALMVSGTFLWGIYGSDVSNTIGALIEESVFD